MSHGIIPRGPEAPSRFRLRVGPHVQDYAIRCTLATHPQGVYAIPMVNQFLRVGASPAAGDEPLDTELDVQVQLGVHVGFGPPTPTDGESEGAPHARREQSEHRSASRQGAGCAPVRISVTVLA